MVLPLALIPLAVSLAAEYAPDFIRHFAGDAAGDVADKVAGVAMAVTGEATPDAAAAAIRNNPEIAATFRLNMQQLDNDLAKAYLADRQDARGRDVQLHRAGYRNVRADLMLVMAFASFLAIIYFAWDGRLDMPDQVFALLNMAAGLILGMLKDAFQFEFGSSRGSKDKDSLLAGPPR